MANTNHTRKPKPNTAALLREIGAPAPDYPAGCNVHIFPDGPFSADDGRPASTTGGKLTHWKLDQSIADGLIAAAKKPVLFDRDHESIYGNTAAAGWVVALHYEPGMGLFGKCEWVGGAAEEVAGKVYRYLSPYFEFDPATGAVVRLLSVALTNDPALDDLGAVALRHQPQEEKMPDPETTQTAALATENGTLKTQVAALTVENESLKGQVAALQKEKTDAALAAESKDRDALIAAACAGDKPRLTPAMAEFAKTLPLAACKTYIETQPVIGLELQAGRDMSRGDGLTDVERAMCERMGVTADQYIQVR